MKAFPVITLENKKHRGSNQILMYFDYDPELIAIARKLPERKWSQSQGCWYVPNNPKNLKGIFAAFKGKAFVDSSKLFKKTELPKPAKQKRTRRLSKPHKTLLNNFYIYLKGKRYSQSTIDTYTYFIADLVEFYNDSDLKKLNNRSVDRFVETVFIDKHYSISTHRQFISAVKQFANFFPECQIENLELRRPKKSRKLPTVLSQEEAIDLLRVATNLKHRAIIALIYSAGLRISELINLELKDINIDRQQLVIKNSKGRKDRYVVLAKSFLPLLKNYFMTYKPKQFFVEGAKGKPYTAGSVRKFLYKYAKRANIQKKVTPHTLRHSYATHLLENGVDLRYIQELLGHAKPETTMIYTHVARKDLLDIQSPLDSTLIQLSKTEKGSQKFLLSRNFTG